MSVIEDGAGKQFQAKVDSNNRLRTKSVSEVEYVSISEETSDSYVVISDFQYINTANTEYGVVYIKNTDSSRNLHIYSIRTCGDSGQRWKLYKNPTTGTLISGANAAGVNNMNFKSNKIANMTAYQGGQSNTITNGTSFEQWINAMGHSEELFQGGVILGPSDSLGLTAFVNNPNTRICTRIITYFKDED